MATASASEALQAVLSTARPRLVRALIAVRGIDGAEDAAAEAIAWGWEHQDRLLPLDDPIAYLYRVALTRSVGRKRPVLPPVEPARMPDVEPGLVPALLELPERQRAAVWLVHACGWRHREVAVALDISPSTVATHVTRGLEALRIALGAEGEA
ncbi:MAG: sigma-70 family RNA polymerase sigma factor [Actinomycetota bacterium]